MNGLIIAICAGVLFADPSKDTIDPKLAKAVQQLVQLQHNEGDKIPSRFLEALATVAAENRWDYRKIDPQSVVERGRAFVVRGSAESYVVVTLQWSPIIVPADWKYETLLLDTRGTLLDNMTCSISTRLFGEGNYTVNDPTGAVDSGKALLSYRFTPLPDQVIAPNFGHTIIHGKRETGFLWENRQQVWFTKGLCDITIAQKRFKFLFPDVP